MRKELASLMGLRYIANGDDISVKTISGHFHCWRPDIDPVAYRDVCDWLFQEYPDTVIRASKGISGDYVITLDVGKDNSGGAVGTTYEEAFCLAVLQVCRKKPTTVEELFQVYPKARIEIAYTGGLFMVDTFINANVFRGVGTTFDKALASALEKI